MRFYTFFLKLKQKVLRWNINLFITNVPIFVDILHWWILVNWIRYRSMFLLYSTRQNQQYQKYINIYLFFSFNLNVQHVHYDNVNKLHINFTKQIYKNWLIKCWKKWLFLFRSSAIFIGRLCEVLLVSFIIPQTTCIKWYQIPWMKRIFKVCSSGNCFITKMLTE